MQSEEVCVLLFVFTVLHDFTVFCIFDLLYFCLCTVVLIKFCFCYLVLLSVNFNSYVFEISFLLLQFMVLLFQFYFTEI
ncbi:hypothetical protein VIGAN_04083600 [Vigna angularis var. angularis]|uniref:Uncharacterized protein n=1 Tax=Vigna angularis var. angularis TaxID=157739 RepID=A0A0S3RSU0_PHAAN|nr:hypothetical protein VIGAN_04083600 [Vigna angularis var. angularis]